MRTFTTESAREEAVWDRYNVSIFAMPDLDEWLTTREAVRLTGFHPDHIRRLLRAKQLEARKWGGVWMVSRKSLSSYLSESRLRGKKRGPKRSSN